MISGMAICVVIPFYNAIDFLTPRYMAFLGALKADKNITCVFWDSSSTDGTEQQLEDIGFDQVHVISPDDFDHGGSRTLAAQTCDSDVVVFLTQDALPVSKDDLYRLTLAFENPAVGAAYGRQLPHEDAHFFARHLRGFNYPGKSHIYSLSDVKEQGIKAAFLSNAFCAYRRSAMDDVGWFPDGLLISEDLYAGVKLLKAGYSLAYVSEACVFHSHNYSVLQEFRRYFDVGAFHRMESGSLADFTQVGSEGWKYVKSEWRLLFKEKRYAQFFEFFLRNGLKFLGYHLGRRYRWLPSQLVIKFSMHPRWWRQYLAQ
ncbi:hypothetical protein AVO42_11465 [Thiomicrospira sp. XS5]|uniref:glycosyltransferase family 2 protein n=1 Tax=Thiomicrospira sp. XS5 TaxID=1775636 RepID=UPI00074992E4|nr:glycosyltransferase [Thiomicrospira sp. XS5]KUJ75885.1 hypothetical protein AVO42_11465 [Thiomicrospira sp. XS5]